MNASNNNHNFTVAITVDFDGESLWLAKGFAEDPAFLSRGQYGGNIAAPRILQRLNEYGLRSSWGIPIHTLRTWPDLCARIAEDHEVFCHGVCHEPLPGMNLTQERELLETQVRGFEKFFGHSPVGYRAPGGGVTPNTVALLEEHGFKWDSSMSGHDLLPYRPRKVVSRDSVEGTVFGEPYDIVEFSTTVDQEDWFSFEFLDGRSQGLMEPDKVLERWKSMIDWGVQNVSGGVLALTLHPQTIGRPHRFEMFDRFLQWLVASDNLRVVPLREVAREYSDENHRITDSSPQVN